MRKKKLKTKKPKQIQKRQQQPKRDSKKQQQWETVKLYLDHISMLLNIVN